MVELYKESILTLEALICSKEAKELFLSEESLEEILTLKNYVFLGDAYNLTHFLMWEQDFESYHLSYLSHPYADFKKGLRDLLREFQRCLDARDLVNGTGAQLKEYILEIDEGPQEDKGSSFMQMSKFLQAHCIKPSFYGYFFEFPYPKKFLFQEPQYTVQVFRQKNTQNDEKKTKKNAFLYQFSPLIGPKRIFSRKTPFRLWVEEGVHKIDVLSLEEKQVSKEILNLSLKELRKRYKQVLEYFLPRSKPFKPAYLREIRDKTGLNLKRIRWHFRLSNLKKLLED